ncbi:MAG: hypothetical protein NT003_03170 [Candidatus Magasanikbacteria bacterium]|nr:hypothetical protein [Candidatus Magasanikbacteria bacterium]
MFASSLLVDWFFSGAKWVQKFYALAPEIWRPMESNDAVATQKRVVRTSLFITLGYCISFLIFYLVMRPGIVFENSVTRGIVLGVTLWLIGPVPVYATQQLFLKYPRQVTRAQIFGWLVKLIISSLIMTLMF